MNDLDKLAAVLADLTAQQKRNADALTLLLTRDPKKEFIYGPNYSPTPRRFNKVQLRTQFTANATGSYTFVSSIDTEEVIINAVANGVTISIRCEFSDFNDFRDVPLDFSTNTFYFRPLPTAAPSGDNQPIRLPCTKKFLRMTAIQTGTPAALGVWTIQPLSVVFLGQ